MTDDFFTSKEAVPWVPHDYQKQAVQFLLEHGAAALFLDPGLGKTSITLTAIKILKERGLLNRVLVVAPLRVCHSVWPEEVRKWPNFSSLRIAVLHGRDKEVALKSNADIYVINPEGLPWLFNITGTGKRVDIVRFKKFRFDTLVIDELSKFKHVGTGRFKAAKQILGMFGRRWGLTGSPVANGLADLFGQCYMLDQGRSFGPYITHFRNRYCVQRYGSFGWDIRKGAEDEIYERIRPLALRMGGEHLKDMPVLIANNIRVDLPPAAMKIYKQLEDELIAQIDNKTVYAATAAAASVKCRQVANGGVYLDREIRALAKVTLSAREWVNLHTAKIDALADLIDELQGSPLLVAYDFEHDLDRLLAKLGKDTPYIGGGVSPKRSSELARQWNAGELPVLLGHPQAVAHGLNLQEAGNHVCWHSLTWNYELYDQFIRRVLRQGNKFEHVVVHHIIARGTIDEVLLRVLGSKSSGQTDFFDALKRMRDEGTR